MLYQKAGNVAKAVELCFEGRLFDQLREIAETLPSDADPALVTRARSQTSPTERSRWRPAA